MEPVTLELKLTNISSKQLMVEKNLLLMTDSMIVIIKRDGGAARQFIPFVRCDCDSPKEPLDPTEVSTNRSSFPPAITDGTLQNRGIIVSSWHSTMKVSVSSPMTSRYMSFRRRA